MRADWERLEAIFRYRVLDEIVLHYNNIIVIVLLVRSQMILLFAAISYGSTILIYPPLGTLFSMVKLNENCADVNVVL
jgi:hypothetical protein